MLYPDYQVQPTQTIELDMRINHHGFTTNWIRQIEAETSTDPILSIVYNFTLDGWP